MYELLHTVCMCCLNIPVSTSSSCWLRHCGRRRHDWTEISSSFTCSGSIVFGLLAATKPSSLCLAAVSSDACHGSVRETTGRGWMCGAIHIDKDQYLDLSRTPSYMLNCVNISTSLARTAIGTYCKWMKYSTFAVKKKNSFHVNLHKTN